MLISKVQGGILTNPLNFRYIFLKGAQCKIIFFKHTKNLLQLSTECKEITFLLLCQRHLCIVLKLGP